MNPTLPSTLPHNLLTGDVIALRTSYGNFLRWTNGTLDGSSSRLDPACHFQVTVFRNGQIQLRASNGGDLCVAIKNGRFAMETVTNTSGDTLRFTVTMQLNGQVSLMTGFRLYLALSPAGNNKGPVLPCGEGVDDRSLFTVVPLYVNRFRYPVFRTRDQVSVQAIDGCYMTRAANNQVMFPANPDPVRSIFTWTRLRNGKVALQANNGRYLRREGGKMWATASEIDAQCHLRPVVLPDGRIALQADNGRYVTLISYPSGNTAEAIWATLGAFCSFAVVRAEPRQSYVETIALLAERSAPTSMGWQPTGNKYVSLINRGEGTWLEAHKDTIDAFSRFTWMVQPDDTALLALGDRHLGRVERMGGGMQVIEVTGTSSDPRCWFKLEHLPDGRVALQADNGGYLRAFLRSEAQGIYTIEASGGQSTDEGCQFKIMRLQPRQGVARALTSGEVIVLRGDNGKYLSGSANGCAFNQDTVDDSCHFVVDVLTDRLVTLQAEKLGRLQISDQADPSPVLANASRSDNDLSQFTIVGDGFKIALQAPGGRTLRRGAADGLVASEGDIGASALFEMLWVMPQALAHAPARVGREMRRPLAIDEQRGATRTQMLWFSPAGALQTTFREGGNAWQTRTLLDGPLTVPVAALPHDSDGSFTVYWNGDDGQVFQARSAAPGVSTGGTPLRVPTDFLAFAPAVWAGREAGSVETFVCDSDFALWHCRRQADGAVLTEKIAEGPVAAQPVAFRSPGNGRLGVFWCDAQGMLKHTQEDSGNASGWATESIPGDDTVLGRRVVSSLPVYNPVELSVNLFWFDDESVLHHSRLTGSTWRTEMIYKPAHLSRPIAPLNDGRQLPPGVKHVGSGGRMYTDEPVPADQAAPYPPATLFNHVDGTLHVFWLTEGLMEAHGLKHISRTAAGWQTPDRVALASGPSEPDSAPAALFNLAQNRLEVFWTATDGNLYTSWLQGGAWHAATRIN